MKISKPASLNAAPEECGVWLDTVQLKGKAKQKQLTRRPISKLLNPFAESGGYSLAVALNFTQTKMEMPKTKQSTISSFFTSKPRVLNKISISDETNADPVQSFSSSTAPGTTALTPVPSGIKRRRGPHLENCDFEPCVDPESEAKHVTEPQATVCKDGGDETSQSHGKTHCQSDVDQLEEFHQPHSKRRFIGSASPPNDTQPPPQAWSQDPLFTFSQYSDSEFSLTDQKDTTESNSNDSETSLLNSLQSEDAFNFQMELKCRTSTQASFKHQYSQFEEDKENNTFLVPISPQKRSHFSHNKPLSINEWTQPKTVSPRKHKEQPWSETDKEDNNISPFKWTRPHRSPLKKQSQHQQRRVVDEDSLVTLFTQDSEGFRVISHRGVQVRSPLKDQGNCSAGAVRTRTKALVVEEEEEDEMLFTQDSQGNLVIKH